MQFLVSFIQRIVASRFSDDILAQVLKLPNYASRMNMYSYAASLSLRYCLVSS